MSTIWIDHHSRLKSYSATTRGRKSVVRIEVECGEPSSLGFLLEECGNIQRRQDEDAIAAKKALKASRAKPLMITDQRGSS